VLVALLASPLKTAVIECVPCVNAAVISAADPPLNVTGEPKSVATLWNVVGP
jgi:hypothetical protein